MSALGLPKPQLQEVGCMDAEWPKNKCPLLLAPERKCDGLVWHQRSGLELRSCREVFEVLESPGTTRKDH